MSRAELRQRAYQNEVPGWKGVKIRDNGPFFDLFASNGAAASLAARDDFWNELEKFDGNITAGFPHRDLALYASSNNPVAIAALRETVARQDFALPEALSRHLYDRRDRRWSLRPA